MNWFVRMARWARHPPSAMQVRILLAVVAFAQGRFPRSYVNRSVKPRWALA